MGPSEAQIEVDASVASSVHQRNSDHAQKEQGWEASCENSWMEWTLNPVPNRAAATVVAKARLVECPK